MFLIRSVAQKDLESLFELSQLVNLINLPPDKKAIKERIDQSLTTFSSPSKNFFKNYYFFVIEDTIEKRIVGSSMIHASNGTEENPNFYLQVGKESKFSETLNTGFVHGTLKLGALTDGPTELGGLIVHPEYRKNLAKVGKQISFVRFLYMGLFPKRFKKTIHSELLPPFDEDGNSPLWEAIGRKFMNMDYFDADKLSRKNKEFILSLFPSDTIYVPLLPMEAREAIGQVGQMTLPVKKMLQDIGFKYINRVDPFDGGPHFECDLKEITLIKNMKKGVIKPGEPKSPTKAIMQIPRENMHFCAIQTEIEITPKHYIIDKKLYEELNLPKEFSTSFITF